MYGKESDTTEWLNWTRNHPVFVQLCCLTMEAPEACITFQASFLASFLTLLRLKLSSIQFSCSIVSDSVTPWTAARQASLSITNSRSLSNSCPSSQWCHPTISSSVVLFSCLQSFPASGSFPMGQFFASGGQSIGASASASVLYNEYSGLISFKID